MNILVIANNATYTFKFRKELIIALINRGHEVFIAVPKDSFSSKLSELGCKIININFVRRKIAPFNLLSLYFQYKKIIKKESINLVLSFTMKPNILGGIASNKLKVPFIPNITGLGSIFNVFIIKSFLKKIYQAAIKNSLCIMFQNQNNFDYFNLKRKSSNNAMLLPGSGVNLNDFPELPYPKKNNFVDFIFLSRIMKEKGIDLYLEAAKKIKKIYNNINFHVVGFCDGNYEKKLLDYQKKGLIIYHGYKENIEPFLLNSNCLIYPSFYQEGVPNAILEFASSGKPIITTDNPGCSETTEDGLTGFICKKNNINDLIFKILSFLKLNEKEMIEMGHNARLKMEREFDRNRVVDSYLKIIESLK
jgi:glycosyltransferase involved in cell wall biosynthesis